LPVTTVNTFLNNMNNGSLSMRPVLQNDFRDAAQSSSTYFTEFISQLSTTLNCQGLYGIYAPVRTSFCCDTTAAIYWIIGSWYMIGWSMLICGCGANILGRKRFAKELWGDEFLNRDLGAGQVNGVYDDQNGALQLEREASLQNMPYSGAGGDDVQGIDPPIQSNPAYFGGSNQNQPYGGPAVPMARDSDAQQLEMQNMYGHQSNMYNDKSEPNPADMRTGYNAVPGEERDSPNGSNSHHANHESVMLVDPQPVPIQEEGGMPSHPGAISSAPSTPINPEMEQSNQFRN